jgi:hypothetical protein
VCVTVHSLFHAADNTFHPPPHYCYAHSVQRPAHRVQSSQNRAALPHTQWGAGIRQVCFVCSTHADIHECIYMCVCTSRVFVNASMCGCFHVCICADTLICMHSTPTLPHSQCFVCGETIEGGSDTPRVRYAGHTAHRKCFNCHICKSGTACVCVCERVRF